jgi:hypothetical protein
MKAPWTPLLAALAIGTAAGAPAPAADTRFAAFGPDFKKPLVLPETFFNPFKVQAEAGPAKKDGPGVAAESVAEAVALRHVTGIVYAPAGGVNRAIIGDQVFGVGDEVSFPDSDKPGLTPLVPGNTVVLREVDAHHLAFDVGAEGETPRRVSFSLRNFWSP